MNRLFIYFVLLGGIISLAFYGMRDALQVMYESPIEQDNFSSFFILMALIVIVIGVFFQWIIPLKRSLIKIDVYGPPLLMLITVVIGNIYSHSLKTDEFLYYFILTHMITMYAVLSAGRQVIVLVKVRLLDFQKAALCIIFLILGAAIIYSANHLIGNYFLIKGITYIYLAMVLTLLTFDRSGHRFTSYLISKPT